MTFPLPCSHFRPSLHLPASPNWHKWFNIINPCLLWCCELQLNHPYKLIQIIYTLLCYVITYRENYAQKVDPLCMAIFSLYRIIPTDDLMTSNTSAYTSATSGSLLCYLCYNIWKQQLIVRKAACSKLSSWSEFYVTITLVQWPFLVVVHFRKKPQTTQKDNLLSRTSGEIGKNQRNFLSDLVSMHYRSLLYLQ